MSLTSSPCDATSLISKSREIGIDRLGIATIHPVPDSIMQAYNQWIARGGNAGMQYLDRYHDVRRDPQRLLDNATSIISCAIGYYHHDVQPTDAPKIASYAHGDDYHEVFKKKLETLAAYIQENHGGETRVCIDTAPIAEKYWAIEAGLGFRGRNGLIIVPGLGSYCFLGEILTTVPFRPTPHDLERKTCDNCGLCIKACPGNAINSHCEVDANKCMSYMTIEHRGPFPDKFNTGGRLYGCDTCQQVCPHNNALEQCHHPEFMLREEYKKITRRQILDMTHEQYVQLFRHSAIKRAKLEGLQRNAHSLE